MKLSDLIGQLQAFREKHGDMNVLSTWESKTNDITVYRANPSGGFFDLPAAEAANLLLIDADDDSYRQAYEHPEDRA